MSKTKFYLLSFVYGLPMTIIGLLVAVCLVITGHKPKHYGYCLHFEMGFYWGGVTLGFVMITDKYADAELKNHEHGHALQNCKYGYLMPFIVVIPSAIRYWQREKIRNKDFKEYLNLPPYDAVWYEAEATKLGTDFINWNERGKQ